MAAVASDLTIYLSGGDVNNDPHASHGGVRSDRDVTSAKIDGLFRSVGASEASAGSTKFRCIYVRNNHPTDSITSVVIWFVSQTSSADTDMSMRLDGGGVGDGKTTGVAQVETDEDTPPYPLGQFTAPSTSGTGLSIGTLAAGECHAVWFKRVVNASASADVRDTCEIGIEGDAV